MLLPPQFWVPHGSPAWRGGVERALMSTTADKAVALFYANGRGTVVEISVGRIQIGGDVSFLSMVPPPPPPPPALVTESSVPSHTCHSILSLQPSLQAHPFPIRFLLPDTAPAVPFVHGDFYLRSP
jgi:hypothetical protein